MLEISTLSCKELKNKLKDIRNNYNIIKYKINNELIKKYYSAINYNKILRILKLDSCFD